MPEITLLLVIACFIIAAMYSITGHAGASGYIAVMALLGMAPQEIKPLALTLNIVVSLVATAQFYRAGHFDRKLFLPFVLGSVPLALLGGYVQLPVMLFPAFLTLIQYLSSAKAGRSVRCARDYITTACFE